MDEGIAGLARVGTRHERAICLPGVVAVHLRCRYDIANFDALVAAPPCHPHEQRYRGGDVPNRSLGFNAGCGVSWPHLGDENLPSGTRTAEHATFVDGAIRVNLFVPIRNVRGGGRKLNF
jgi:hypothetical protein